MKIKNRYISSPSEIKDLNLTLRTVRSFWERLLKITKPRHFHNLARMGLRGRGIETVPTIGAQAALEMAQLAIFRDEVWSKWTFARFPAPNSQKYFEK